MDLWLTTTQYDPGVLYVADDSGVSVVVVADAWLEISAQDIYASPETDSAIAVRG